METDKGVRCSLRWFVLTSDTEEDWGCWGGCVASAAAAGTENTGLRESTLGFFKLC